MGNNHFLTGLIAAPFTPMTDDGEVNYPAIKALADHLAEAGCINGAFICGTTGEYASLTINERKAIAEAWISEAAGRFKVIVHVGSNCGKDSAELAAHAQAVGADAIASIAPNYFRPSCVKALVEFFKPIAAAASGIPFFFYNFPGMSGVHVKVKDFLLEGKKVIPNLTGVKFTHNDFFEMQQITSLCDGAFDILNGYDEVLIAGLACGACGAVGSTYTYIPKIYQKVIDALAAGDIQEARKWQQEAVKIIDVLIAHGGGTRGGKIFMKLAGVDCGQCRYPIDPVSDDEYEATKSELQATKFFECI